MEIIKKNTPQKSVALTMATHSVFISILSLISASVVFQENFFAYLRPTTYLMFAVVLCGTMLRMKRKKE